MTDPQSPGPAPGDATPTSPPNSPPQAPPPPPSALTAPPGAVAYNTGAYGTGQLSRVRGLGTATTLLMVASAALIVVRVIFENSLRPTARDFLNGEIGERQFINELGLYGVFGIVILGVQIASVVVTIVWLYRIAKNNDRLGRSGTWGPGWAIGGWFAPPILFVIPTLTIDQQWRADSPGTTTNDWPQSTRSPLVLAWGVAFSLSILLPFNDLMDSGRLDGGLSQISSTADAIANPTGVAYAATALSFAAAVLFAVVAYQLTARHAQMTGETAA